MKHVLILRHAQAAPAGGQLADIDRPLTPAGMAQATALGALLRDWGLPLGRVDCSAALRARQTAEAVIAGGGFDATPQPAGQLYNASGEELLAHVQRLPEGGDRVLLVAHVPGVAELLSLLTTEHVDLAVAYRAGTLAAVASEEARWADLDYGTGFVNMVLPPVAGTR